MNSSNQSQRWRGAANSPALGARQVSDSDARNGGPNPTTMSRAERFEDEKRRIIDSCFARRDADGSIAESYITHIRIVEDAAFPSSPPPPQSPQENKKPRIIIVAVRKSGRVRMHKARENANGSFSIGKTWVLDDLTVIESFVGAIPSTPEEQQRKEWAGSAGFMVTIQKPYYWQARTPKEKDFFIGSLIKIYRKYTGGKLPQLYGFSPQEFEQITGVPGQQPKRPKTPTNPPELGASASYPPSSSNPSAVLHSDSRSETDRELGSQPSVNGSLRQLDRQDHEDAISSSYPSSDFVRNLRPQDSQSQFRPSIPASPAASISRNNDSEDLSLQEDGSLRPLGDTQSTESLRIRQENQGTNPSIDRLRPHVALAPGSRDGSPARQHLGSSDGNRTPDSPRSGKYPTPELNHNQISERKRPPIPGSVTKSELASAGAESTDEFMTPSTTPMTSANALQVPPRSSDRFRRDISLSADEQLHPSEGYFQAAADVSTLSTDPARQGAIASPSVDLAASEKPAVAVSIPSTPATPGSPLVSPIEEEVHRPGLGPMIKKKSNKDIANTLRKAATAYNAFKPRTGGAAEKVRDETVKSPNQPDGINGVFPAPSLRRGISQDNYESPTSERTPIDQSLPQDQAKSVPEFKIIAPPTLPKDPSLPTTPTAQQSSSLPDKLTNTPTSNQDERRRKPKSDHSARYAKALGVIPSLLEGRTFDIESILSDFGWGDEERQRKSYDELQLDIRRELAHVETGSWLGTFEHNEERVAAVGKMLDRAIAECEELDGLLTLYNVELGTLSEDVAYIEAQSQGLQVQTANQKLLHTELQSLLETISISASQLQVLRDASLTKSKGIQDVETILSHLYKAMLTIDPSLRHNSSPLTSVVQLNADRGSVSGSLGSEISTMRAVQEKKAVYRNESVDFLQRLKQYMSVKFREAEAETAEAIERRQSSGVTKASPKLDFRLREIPRRGLWPYSPLMLFAREIDTFEWEELMRMYEFSLKKPYQEEFKENMIAWRRIARKPTADEQDVLFTTQEKETEGIVVRKLTVKRSKTLRSDGSTRNSSGEKSRDGNIAPHEAFAGALNDIAQLVFMEQNFVVDLFHVSSLESLDFPDIVATVPPDARKGGNIFEKKLFDPDRNMAKRLLNTMDDIYSFLPTELQSLVDWAVKQDALQGVGVLYALESKMTELEETNQEYLTQTLGKIHGRLAGLFMRFVEEQIKGIEDTKVKIKKRKGVIAFMKTFPNFSLAIESMLPPPHTPDQPEIRYMVNDAYLRTNKAMFESLNFIAKESPIVMTAQGGQGPATGDPEDKEALNYHILLIENMNHYIEEVDIRANTVLEEWRDRAIKEMSEHMDLYLGAVIRRPLGRLLDFLESTESLLSLAADGTAISTRASHSRSTLKKLLATYDAKEMRRGVETLKKRVEKHFGDADDPSLSRNLVQRVLRECEDRYHGIHDRTMRIIQDVYEGGLEVEWRKEDVSTAFRR